MNSTGSSQFSEDSFSLPHSDSSFCGEIGNEPKYRNTSGHPYFVGSTNLLSFPPVQYDSFRSTIHPNGFSYSNSECDVFEGILNHSLL